MARYTFIFRPTLIWEGSSCDIDMSYAPLEITVRVKPKATEAEAEAAARKKLVHALGREWVLMEVTSYHDNGQLWNTRNAGNDHRLRREHTGKLRDPREIKQSFGEDPTDTRTKAQRRREAREVERKQRERDERIAEARRRMDEVRRRGK